MNTIICEITSVTAAWSGSNTTATFVLGVGTTELENSVAGDGSVYRIGHATNIEVGTGVVTAVATAGTDFTLSNNDIVTKQDFKMHIIGRVQNAQSRCSQLAKDINCYSFALKPEEHQPSGTCNFSRIDTAKLNFSASTGSAGDIILYAVNYNVLRIMSGMGGLAYSN